MSLFDPKPTDTAQHDAMRGLAIDADALLVKAAQTVKPGRYFALFQTNLETAMMYLNKAIAHDGLKDSGSDGA